ncbi:IST1 FAMILY MEMBER [Salix koriyanagi]|uniref:IST1 FAMILY MEMBER n=1 Tax=Salix koriyanagi TaxID=2511006 RepID=A0A9Q0UXA0_9ROSI|nr:IST1 FAMILY MEMBER [Salix koriyanagi]
MAQAEQVLKDQSLLDAYDLVDRYCEFIYLHFPYIRRHKDRPKDINEAVSTLIFAAACFGDLPELRVIRKLFGKRYGQKFIKDVAALQTGNLVDHEIMEKLCPKFISDGVKLKLINEIAMDYGLQLWYWGCDNKPKQHLLQMPGKHRSSVGEVLFSRERLADTARTGTPEISLQYPKRTDYVDEVEELEFNGDGKSLFLFNTSLRPLIDNYVVVGGSTLLALSHHGYSEGNCSKPKPEDKIALSRRTHGRIRNSYGHRLQRRVDTKNNHEYESFLTPVNVKDNDCVVFNGQFCNISPYQKQFYHRISQFQNKPRTMMPAKERRSASSVCYEKCVQSCKRSSRFSPEKNFRRCSEKSCCKCDSLVNGTRTQENKKLMETEESSDCPARLKGPSPDSRKKTIPPKRLKGVTTPDNDDSQSVSSQLELSKGSTASSCGHVHPKLPDYDEIAAKFIALKKEHQLRTNA